MDRIKETSEREIDSSLDEKTKNKNKAEHAMGRRSALYLGWFSLLAVGAGLLWTATMRVERRSLPSSLSLPLGPQESRARAQVRRLPAAHLARRLDWSQAEALDAMMRGEQGGIFWMEEESEREARIVFGSRRQVFVRGQQKHVDYAQRIFTGKQNADESLAALRAPLATRYSITFSLLVENGDRVDDAVWSWAAEQGWLGHLSTVDPWTVWPVLVVAAALVAAGWRVVTVWECDLKAPGFAGALVAGVRGQAATVSSAGASD